MGRRAVVEIGFLDLLAGDPEQAQTSVNVPYLDSVLYLLGISREEIEEADLDDGTPTHAPPVPQTSH